MPVPRNLMHQPSQDGAMCFFNGETYAFLLGEWTKVSCGTSAPAEGHGIYLDGSSKYTPRVTYGDGALESTELQKRQAADALASRAIEVGGNAPVALQVSAPIGWRIIDNDFAWEPLSMPSDASGIAAMAAKNAPKPPGTVFFRGEKVDADDLAAALAIVLAKAAPPVNATPHGLLVVAGMGHQLGAWGV